MLKGLILKDDNTILRVLVDIIEIDESKKHILFGSSGKLGGIDFTLLNLVVTDDQREFKEGDTLPPDIVDNKSSLKKNTDERIKMLEKDNHFLRMELDSFKNRDHTEKEQIQTDLAMMAVESSMEQEKINKATEDHAALVMELTLKGVL
ncbi:hypothetical protein KHA94_16225 [Bacillus sp. FJAT-49705]|uniref:Uncharacterized protein n=1 Tax=Cytobacillus citreus TaxID=2833586 RepID=A0ABS5NNB5_9BACI|nr:hypothetical protein [Cytobacillus citreus]MBS4188658.1 hypothetical protein [Cytobacillus citreus]MBS4191737.1 hypothetical protein [Cytobacillus citreus]